MDKDIEHIINEARAELKVRMFKEELSREVAEYINREFDICTNSKAISNIILQRYLSGDDNCIVSLEKFKQDIKDKAIIVVKEFEVTVADTLILNKGINYKGYGFTDYYSLETGMSMLGYSLTKGEMIYYNVDTPVSDSAIELDEQMEMVYNKEVDERYGS